MLEETIITSNLCKAARNLLDWKQEDLAEKSEVAVATISFFERGLKTPRPRTLKAIRDAFEVAGIEFEITINSFGLRLVTKHS